MGLRKLVPENGREVGNLGLGLRFCLLGNGRSKVLRWRSWSPGFVSLLVGCAQLWILEGTSVMFPV